MVEPEKRYPLKQIMSPGFIFTTGRFPLGTLPAGKESGKGTPISFLAWFDGGASESRYRKMYDAAPL